MAKWWTVLALIPLLLADPASARVQSDDGPPAMQGAFSEEPQAPGSGPEFCPDTKPASSCWSIPFGPRFDFFNAFTEDCHGPDYCVGYGGVGTLALMRGRLGSGIVAVEDPGKLVNGVVTHTDTAIKPTPLSAPPVLGFGSVPTGFDWGVLATVGRRYGPYALEVTAFYLPWSSSSVGKSQQGSLDLPFSAVPPPTGFLGDNFLWLQADRVVITYQSRVSSAEANVRYQWLPKVEALFGVRYFEAAERFSIYTGDDDLLPLNTPNLARLSQATYTTTTLNQIVGPQVGFQAETFLVPNLSLGLVNKDMVGANVYRATQSLTRGDAFQGPMGKRGGVRASEVFELDVIGSLWLNDHIRFRAGYMALWATNVPVANQQVNFNPNIGGGTVNNNGSIFFHGPMLELMLAF